MPASGTLDIPARPASSIVLTQHSSGSLPVTASVLDGRGSSLDLGLLPPREMQVLLNTSFCHACHWQHSALCWHAMGEPHDRRIVLAHTAAQQQVVCQH